MLKKDFFLDIFCCAPHPCTHPTVSPLSTHCHPTHTPAHPPTHTPHKHTSPPPNYSTLKSEAPLFSICDQFGGHRIFGGKGGSTPIFWGGGVHRGPTLGCWSNLESKKFRPKLRKPPWRGGGGQLSPTPRGLHPPSRSPNIIKKIISGRALPPSQSQTSSFTFSSTTATAWPRKSTSSSSQQGLRSSWMVLVRAPGRRAPEQAWTPPRLENHFKIWMA